MSKVSPGQVSPLVTSVSEINRTLEASDDFHRRKARGEGRGTPGGVISTDIIKVKNETGADRSAGAVVELGEYMLDDVTREHLIIEGIAVSAQGVPNVAVLLKAHPHHDILPAQVSGVCVAKVNVVNVDDRCCYVKEGEYRFTTCAIGHHRILQALTDTGEQLCVVGLGTGILTCLGFAAEAIASGSSGDVDVATGAFNEEEATGQTIPGCGNHGPDIADEQVVTVGILHGQFYVAALGCEE